MDLDHSIYASKIAAALACSCPTHWSNLTQGRSNFVWRRRCACGDFVVKRYQQKTSSPLFRNDAAAEWCVLQALADQDLAPNPRLKLQFETCEIVALYDYVQANTWQSTPETAAKLLNQFRYYRVEDLPPRHMNCESLNEIVEKMLLALPDHIADQHRAKMPKTITIQSTIPSLVHGDFTPTNILVHDTKAWAIDWQTPWWGDPLLDVMIFLSPSMQAHGLGRVLTPQEHMDFLNALESPDLADRYDVVKLWFAWVMAAYGLWRKYQRQDQKGDEAYALEISVLGSEQN